MGSEGRDQGPSTGDKAISGSSDRRVRRLEEGETVPHPSSLKKRAEAHGMEVNAYLRELAKVSARRSWPRAE
jgi:hypothetical protein